MSFEDDTVESSLDGQEPLAGAFSDAWAVLKGNYGMTLGIMLVVMILSIIFNIPARLFGSAEDPNVVYSLLGIVATMLTTILSAGASLAFVRMIRGDEGVAIGDIFVGFERPVPIVVAAVLTTVIGSIGLIFLIVPGIVAFLGLSMSQLLIVDRGYDGVNALKASWEMMKGYKLSLFMFGLAMLFIMLISLIPLGLGLLISVPFATLAFAAFYQRVLEANPPSDEFPDF